MRCEREIVGENFEKKKKRKQERETIKKKVGIKFWER
jgi:hypothetical protein